MNDKYSNKTFLKSKHCWKRLTRCYLSGKSQFLTLESWRNLSDIAPGFYSIWNVQWDKHTKFIPYFYYFKDWDHWLIWELDQVGETSSIKNDLLPAPTNWSQFNHYFFTIGMPPCWSQIKSVSSDLSVALSQHFYGNYFSVSLLGAHTTTTWKRAQKESVKRLTWAHVLLLNDNDWVIAVSFLASWYQRVFPVWNARLEGLVNPGLINSQWLRGTFKTNSNLTKPLS